MRNIYLIEFYESAVSGFGTFKAELEKCIIQLGHKMNRIVLNAPIQVFSIKTEGGTTIYNIPHTISRQLDLMPFILGLYINNNSSNVFLHNFSPSYNVVALFRKYFSQCKIVYIIHDFIWLSKLMGNISEFKKRIMNNDESDSIIRSYNDGIKTFNLVDRVVCLSNDTFNLLEQDYHINKSKLSYIPNGLSNSCKELSFAEKKCIREEYHIGENEKVFLFVGRICMQKGVIDLLEAFALLAQRYINFRLIFAGDVPSNFLNYIPYSIRNRITLLGNVDTATLYKIYSITDAGVISSYYEQCSYVGIEMKMFSLPVIASDAFGVRCMFDDSNAITYHVEKDRVKTVSNLYHAIRHFLNMDAVHIHRISVASRESYTKCYSSEAMRNNYNELLTII